MNTNDRRVVYWGGGVGVSDEEVEWVMENVDPRKESPALRKATRAYVEAVIDEILPPIRLAAMNEGYAIALHGTLARDIDLVAIPWVESAREPDLLVSHIRGILAGFFGACYVSADWVEKPHGRRAKTFHSHTMTAEIDLSVMPRVTPTQEIEQ